jgi:hypothetical protein
MHKQQERSEPDSGRPSLAGSLAVRAKKPITVPADLRTSVSRMRSNIKGISSTIRQVEETMDTIYGAMEMLDSLGKPAQRASSAAAAANRPSPALPDEQRASGDAAAAGADSPSGNSLGGLDMNQLLAILQSPLVQSLLSQQSGGANKRKKEG